MSLIRSVFSHWPARLALALFGAPLLYVAVVQVLYKIAGCSGGSAHIAFRCELISASGFWPYYSISLTLWLWLLVAAVPAIALLAVAFMRAVQDNHTKQQ